MDGVLFCARNWPAGCLSFASASAELGSAFDTECEAACCRAVDLDVVDVGMREQSLDWRLVVAVGDKLTRDQMTAASIGFESAGAGAQLFGEAGIDVVTRAFGSMNVDRPRLWEVLFHAGEAVVSKQDALINTWPERAQAV